MDLVDTLPAPEGVFGADVQDLLLAEFRRAADHVPSYQALLSEHGVPVEQVVDVRTFSRLCPLLSQRNTFGRFPLAQLSVGGELRDIADVLTSSGHGGHFAFGVSTRREAAASASFIDAALDMLFAVESKPTLVVNCLPMGVVFSSHRTTVATTSVREDMAVALVQTFGDSYQQLILVGDPLFTKRLTDYAAAEGVDWGRYRLNAIIGEEVFGEHFRNYVAHCFGLDLDRPQDGYIMSSLGVAELGLNLGFETPATIALRRLAVANPALARDLLGRDEAAGLSVPMIFAFNPRRTFIEIVEPDDHGYGQLTISMLDPERSIPLLRYQTGDWARLLDRDQVVATAARHGVALGDLPSALLALQGRKKESLPNGSHVGFYKDALYADPELARHLTGALRLMFNEGRGTIHVQLVRGGLATTALEQGLLQALSTTARPMRLVLWPYAEFPFGMSLDYERKFSHYVPKTYARSAYDASPLVSADATGSSTPGGH